MNHFFAIGKIPLNKRFKLCITNTETLKTEILKKFYKKTNCFFGVNGVGEIDEITGRLEKVIESI